MHIWTARIQIGLLFKNGEPKSRWSENEEEERRIWRLYLALGLHFPEQWRNRCGHRKSVNFFVLLLSSSVLKKYMENTYRRKAVFSKRESLPCIAPLLTTVEETAQIISAQVRGHFPKWLNGCLLRTGPGKFEFGKDK